MMEYKTTIGICYKDSDPTLTRANDPEPPNRNAGPDWEMCGSTLDGETILWFWRRDW